MVAAFLPSRLSTGSTASSHPPSPCRARSRCAPSAVDFLGRFHVQGNVRRQFRSEALHAADSIAQGTVMSWPRFLRSLPAPAYLGPATRPFRPRSHVPREGRPINRDVPRRRFVSAVLECAARTNDPPSFVAERLSSGPSRIPDGPTARKTELCIHRRAQIARRHLFDADASILFLRFC